MAKDLSVLGLGAADAGDGLARDDKDVVWRLRVHVPDGDTYIVLWHQMVVARST